MGIAQYRTGDFSSAFSNFKKAAELSAQYSGGVADTYWLGLGVVEQDLPKAMELYGEAALAGRDLWANIYALNYQMKEYEKGNYDNKALTLYMDYFHAKSMDESKEVWMSKLTQAADLGFPPAQVDLWIYCRDSKEFSKGMLYLQKAAELDYVPAWFHLGYAYHAGLGVNIDYQMAEKWYENAAVEGHPTAQNNLGVLYQTNKIPSSKNPFKNAAMAYYWYNEAAEQGYAQAKYNRSQMKNASKEIFGRTATNRITKIISTSAETHRALDKSKMKTYTPSSETTGK